MLSELFLSPVLFDREAYADQGATSAEQFLGNIKKPLLEEFLVRDLHGGYWFAHLDELKAHLPTAGKELLKKLRNQKRLVHFGEDHESSRPRNEEDWEIEAFKSEAIAPLSGLIVSHQAKTSRHRLEKRVTCPEQLDRAPFWSNRSCSRRVERNTQSYLDLIRPILEHANSIMFIDPHLDPSKSHYRDFVELLVDRAITSRRPRPLIEIHRVAWMGDGSDKTPKNAAIEELFRKHWSPRLAEQRIQVDIHLWDDLHDRFLWSDLISTSWTNGFDTTTKKGATVTVARLSRADGDDLQQEFAVNSSRHHHCHKFSLGLV